MISLEVIRKKASDFKVGQKVIVGVGAKEKEGIIYFIHPEGRYICVQHKKYKECHFPDMVSLA